VFYISHKIKDLVKMSIDKYSFRKRLQSAPALKKWNRDKSPIILTRSALRYLLFNTSKT